MRNEDGTEHGVYEGIQPRQAALKAANRSEGTKANPVTIRKRTWDKEGARFQGMA